MKKVLLLTLPLMLLCGCQSAGIAKVVRELKGDRAIVKAKVTTPWGSLEFERDGSANTNSVPAK